MISLPKNNDIASASEATIDDAAEIDGAPDVSLTDKEMAEASKVLGTTRIKLSKFKSLRHVGNLLKEHGAVQVAVGQYLVNNDLRDKLIQFCIERMGNVEDTDGFCNLVQSVGGLLNAKDAAIKQVVDSVKSGHFKEQPQQPQHKFPKVGQQVIGQQVNVLVQEESERA